MNSILHCLKQVGVQWDHPDLSGCTQGWGAGWAVAWKRVLAELYKAEEPVDRHWTVTVVGAD